MRRYKKRKSTISGVVGVWYLFLPHSHSFALQNPEVQASGMIGFLFLAFSGFIIALGEATVAQRRYQNRRLPSAGESESKGVTYLLHRSDTGWKIAALVRHDMDEVVRQPGVPR